MSKKIWRGVKRDQIDCLWVDSKVMPQDKGTDCTVVMDSAHFPVREAMAFMRFCEKYHNSVVSNQTAESGQKTWDKYLAAVAKMKKKAKVKRG